MIPGYMGKILWVDLTTGKITEETPDEQLYKDYIGGYGLAARLFYDRMKPNADPLGPDNILGLVTGPVTGTSIPASARYAVVAKSPLSGGWGDANSGGFFGPYLKFAGFDAVFFTGASKKPVYLLIDEGKAEIKDAGALWGKSSYETEDILEAEYGKNARVSCIGPAGEKLSLIAAVMTDHGSAAGRSGLGAVMGSKKLKAVVARGTKTVPVADEAAAKKLRTEHVDAQKVPGPMNLDAMHKYGTSALTAMSAKSGDTPVKNWGGVGVVDLGDTKGLDKDTVFQYVAKGGACWHCPIACKAWLKEGTGEYKFPAGARRPEYETQGAFGACCGNTNAESINAANNICNSYGLDTISAGTVISFAIELYENGIITQKDTYGLDLKWGNHQAMVAMTEKMAQRAPGLGDKLADGVKVAAEKIGKGSEKYAVHIGGQELGMHDPKLGHGMAYVRYQLDATPGRHTAGFGPQGGFAQQIVNSSGLCLIGFGFGSGPDKLAAFFNAITGLNYSADDILKCGERIENMRHLFNLREGINELKWYAHPRTYGDPAQKEGPLAGVTIPRMAQMYWSLGAMDWDLETLKPSKKKLQSLGMNKEAEALWPPQKGPGPH
jgi:aldehyde:ferredoxin oxidoreductase